MWEVAKKLGIVFGAGLSTLSMVGLFVAGILKILGGVFDLLRGPESVTGLARVLNGIELLFLAPLALLAYLSMVLFVQQYFSSVAQGAAGRKPAPGVEIIHGVKLALAFLVVAVLLTDLVEKSLTNHHDSWLSLTAECSGIVLGLAYATIIHRMDGSH